MEALAGLATLDPATLTVVVLVVVLAAAMRRPNGPVTIHARDITVRQEVNAVIK